ncbi:MAG TPA: type II toxin-antitoxin system RelE/ParE family toxin [Salegentibacter sp.]|nr:type II toxin-antitoxin system RelE/ParE family toxin [Salegentibacter sp.]
MEKVIWSEQAKLDLFHIWEFYYTKNLKAAEKIINKIIETAENITFPSQYQRE